jgi:hypothetical protein
MPLPIGVVVVGPRPRDPDVERADAAASVAQAATCHPRVELFGERLERVVEEPVELDVIVELAQRPLNRPYLPDRLTSISGHDASLVAGVAEVLCQSVRAIPRLGGEQDLGESHSPEPNIAVASSRECGYQGTFPNAGPCGGSKDSLINALGNVQDRVPVSDHARIFARGDPPMDLVIQLFALFVLHCYVA